jgi:hypothetical protein
MPTASEPKGAAPEATLRTSRPRTRPDTLIDLDLSHPLAQRLAVHIRPSSNRLDRPELLAGFLAGSDTIRTARVRRGWVRLVDDHRVLHPPRHVSSTSNATTT